MKGSMKPPFKYFGGKQRMACKIVPLIPKHTVYVEPFAGSAAVMFAKPWPAVSNNNHYREVINDTNVDVVNFFRQLRDNGEELARLCSLTPCSREEFSGAKDPVSGDDLERARRFFVNISQSFGGMLHGGWGTAVYGKNEAATWFGRNSRLMDCAARLASIHIENQDALQVIKRWDSPQTLFYCDPPYPDTCQGHYDGYTAEDLQRLIETLDQCQGSFLLSCYGADVPDYWEKFEFSSHCAVSGKGKTGSGRDKSEAATNIGNRKRTEVVYRVIRGDNVRKEIKKLYQLGLFDCFEGKRGE